jgi:predicted transcriptional regulator
MVIMARLGDLERSVMDVLWDTAGWLTAREVAARLEHERDLAYTTVLTVLERLERKGFVRRERSARAHRYAAADTRDAAVAEAMMAALDTTSDRDSALVRFVGSVSVSEAEIIRKALAVPLDLDGVPRPDGGSGSAETASDYGPAATPADGAEAAGASSDEDSAPSGRHHDDRPRDGGTVVGS